MSGIVAEQIANDADGHVFTDQTDRAIRIVLADMGSSARGTSRRRR
jgi:hypothetical protein